MKPILQILAAMIAILTLAGGCGNQTTSPSFAELTEKLDSLHTSIKEGIAANDEKKVHMALHSVSSNLSLLSRIDSADLNSTDTDTVRAAAERMKELYGKIDFAIHEGESPDYDSVADELASELATIKSFVK